MELAFQETNSRMGKQGGWYSQPWRGLISDKDGKLKLTTQLYKEVSISRKGNVVVVTGREEDGWKLKNMMEEIGPEKDERWRAGVQWIQYDTNL
jgi:hypothetical protein